MWRNEIIVECSMLTKVIQAKNLNDKEKNDFFKYISYLTEEEKNEFILTL